ncbi:uncharacterized protein I303_108353 [Kwoniella dejecticola CBS 10117]|uniref:Uncharacterized protein n=1 Tax=Kwoniella dejecticola CBS 10117 TaxID=1296121 RepID=A0A1A5ZXM6_9TREE|nr:uncharacterized protein I303_07319 [Kwoniella dejecticola CBS 10117]OBR82559.1 hypothetical protein I303_07319 [Kwoniella dejecticola CBS 10117]
MFSTRTVPRGPGGQLPSSTGLPSSSPASASAPKSGSSMLLTSQQLADWPPKNRPIPGGGKSSAGQGRATPGLPIDQLTLPTPNYLSGTASSKSAGYSNQATYDMGTSHSDHSAAQGLGTGSASGGQEYPPTWGGGFDRKKPSFMSRLFGRQVEWDESMYGYPDGKAYKVPTSHEKANPHNQPIQIEPEKRHDTQHQQHQHLPGGKPPPHMFKMHSFQPTLPEDFDYMPSQMQKFYIKENKLKEKEWKKKFKQQEKLWKIQMKDWEKSEKERVKAERKTMKEQEKAERLYLKQQNHGNPYNYNKYKYDPHYQHQHQHPIRKPPTKTGPEADPNNPYNFMLLPANEFGVRRPFNPMIGGTEKWPNMSRTMTHALLDMNREEQLHAYHASLIRAPNW